jgi:uncharacterized protein
VINRALDEQRLRHALESAPVVLLTGPRQSGKSTLVRSIVETTPDQFFDLENPRDLVRLGEPITSLADLDGTTVIDEAQHRQDLFPVLRVLADQNRRPGRFLILGSASPDLVGLAAESLAGRVTLLELGGLRVSDVSTDAIETLWERGGFPPSLLSANDQSSCEWRDQYIRTFLERDLTSLGIRIPATTMRRFWTMIAHYHGQTWNASEIARSLGVSPPTVGRYLDALTNALVVRQLHPWFATISKRQVRAPKVYVRDTGLLHRLLGIGDGYQLSGHPKFGASWEGFVIEQLLARGDIRDPSFWRTHNGAELDLFLLTKGKRVGIEIKLTSAPRVTPSMRSALVDLELDKLIVAHSGEHRFAMADKIEAIPAQELLTADSLLA